MEIKLKTYAAPRDSREYQDCCSSNFISSLLSAYESEEHCDVFLCQISRIKPGKGEAVVYPKDVKKLINHMILQIPTPKTKGIIIYPTGIQFCNSVFLPPASVGWGKVIVSVY